MHISRLFEIVYILLNKKNVTAVELSEHFEVSTRTIYRDIDTLNMAGIPVYTMQGKGGGIGLLDNFILNKAYLSKQEQSEILTAIECIRRLDHSASKQIMDKLSHFFQQEQSTWIEVDFNSWSNQQGNNFFNQLKEAILSKKMMTFTYYNNNGEKSHRTVEPIRLIFKYQDWYLYAYCHMREDYRYFKLNRMEDLVSTEEHFETDHQDALPQEHQQTNTEKIHLTLKFEQEAAFRIRDEYSNVLPLEDGSMIIEVDLEDKQWVYSYLLSFGSQVTVLAPLEIKEGLLKIIEDIRHKYDS